MLTRREVFRVLRWRHAGFRRRRLPYVWECHRLFSWRGLRFHLSWGGLEYHVAMYLLRRGHSPDSFVFL